MIDDMGHYLSEANGARIGAEIAAHARLSAKRSTSAKKKDDAIKLKRPRLFLRQITTTQTSDKNVTADFVTVCASR